MRENPSSSLLMTAVRSLSFAEDRTEILAKLSPGQWTQLLTLTDDARITLPLAIRCRSMIPESIVDRLDGCVARNAVRHSRIVEAHTGIAEAMVAHGAEFLVLKGLTHGRFWPGCSQCRPQYDVDLYCPPDSIRAASEAAASLGYEPFGPSSFGRSNNGADHFPVMIRRTGWRWRGDYYDPEQPLALELHHRFWNPDLGFAVHGADRFWKRRSAAVFDGVALPALHPVDGVDYAAWHALRHLLQGSLRVYQIYELASYLHHTAGDHASWRGWSEQGAPADRLAESFVFRLAKEWFGCRLNPIVDGYVQALPANVLRWLRLFAFSPITAVGRPNKDELILNLCLAQNDLDRYRIATRRIFPALVPFRVLDAHVASERSKTTPRLRWARVADWTQFTARRVLHHGRALGPVVRSSLRWWLPDRSKPSLET